MTIKLCCFCEHMKFDHEEPLGGGCKTCGYGADEGRNDMVCQKGHWQTGLEWSLTTYREKIRAAETCPDFKLAEFRDGASHVDTARASRLGISLEPGERA